MLLNVCCAPCALPLIEIAAEKPALYFYGANLYPAEEYARRLEATKAVASHYGLDIYEGPYEHDAWLEYIRSQLPKPPESYQENSERCQACFRFRLERTADFAAAKGFSSFAATLSVSSHKDVAYINEYAQALATQQGLEYKTFPIGAADAHRRGRELSKELGVYRQKYCGCEFSLPRKA